MKKMIVLTSLWSFLFIFSFSMFGCSEDDDEFGTTAERGNEVRTPRVEEINGKAVVSFDIFSSSRISNTFTFATG